MPSIKVYPPNQLPDRGINETQFNIWIEELEVYLGQEAEFRVFLTGEEYDTWEPKENNSERIVALKGADVDEVRDATKSAALLKLRQRQLRTVLSIVGKCVSSGHYDAVMRHSTSLESIYDMLRGDYDMQKKGIHFLNLLDMKYEAANLTPIAFYNQYRTMITSNLARRNDVIKYKNNTIMAEDEKMSPMLEDMVLLNVVREIDPRLPAFIRTFYTHKMSKADKLMDFKNDIFTNIPKFLVDLEKDEQLASISPTNIHPSLSAFKQRGRGNTRGRGYNPRVTKDNPNKIRDVYCRLCHKCEMPREIFKSHNIGDPNCPQLSAQDKIKLAGRMSNIAVSEEDEEDRLLAAAFGYDTTLVEEQLGENQVNDGKLNLQSANDHSRTNGEKLSYIKPEPTQILTVFNDASNNNAVHIELDSGATLNYIRESEAFRLSCKILPNGQLSTLGDGVTKLSSVGEIDVIFFRNSWTVRFRAIVVKHLQSPIIGGTVFLKDNKMEQNLCKQVIHIHDRKITVPETNPTTLLPILEVNKSPQSSSCPSSINTKTRKGNSSTVSFKSLKLLLPGQDLQQNTYLADGTVVTAEPWEQNNYHSWPEPQLCTVKNSSFIIKNTSKEPIILGKDIKLLKIRATETSQNSTDEDMFYEGSSSSQPRPKEEAEETIKEIQLGDHITTEALELLKKAHKTYKEVFNKDLRGGYNDFYGKHRCQLNWAGRERPFASKVHVPSYKHDLKGLQQELMDDLTNQGVLLIPQEHDIRIQSVCPSFLQKKQRAKNKAQHLLTKDDVRLLINFGPVNEKIKPIPSHVAKTDDVIIALGRWKELIVFDLYNGYFQIKMSDKAIPWLGVQTPFGGLRAIARSGQGLLGQAEEFDEVLAKILKEELKEGICAKIVDDIYVGGSNQTEAALNYIRILSKLKNANMKISPDKTHIFPNSVDVLGWVWKRGGFLAPSPHRQCALSNVKEEDIRKIKDMRSWIGLYKTLHIATPRITSFLDPFEQATAGKDTNDKFVWTHDLSQRFREAKNHIKNMKALYLPSPDDQLMMIPDGSKMTPGIGHVLYAIKDGKKIPVRFGSTKLKDNCRKWSPCEIEALAFAGGIEKEFDIIRESKHPLIICPDNKPVHDAVSLINRGHFSVSARMSSFLTNVNRIPIISQHISGKAKLNPLADLQSRHPPQCDSDVCTIDKFINTSIDGIITNEPKCAAMGSLLKMNIFTNRNAWKKAQADNQACAFAIHLLSSGKTPPKAVGKTAGPYFNEVRFYCREGALANDGLLVSKTQLKATIENVPKEKIIVPKHLVPALLWHLHNHYDEHPTKHQQKVLFQRSFFTMNLEKHLNNLYDSCYKCQVLQKLPKEMIQQETKTNATNPHEFFHADIIKRAGQKIMIIADHFSSLANAALINSESASDLKQGMILLTTTMRKPDWITIKVDNAPGFQSLAKSEDKELIDLKINLTLSEEFNKNANAVADKCCQEFEQELTKFSPEGSQVSQAQVSKAVLAVNRKIRRRGKISAFELHTARSLITGENLILNDEQLHEDQISKRMADNSRTKSEEDEIKVGDTVILKNKAEKHYAKDMFIVTSKLNDKTKVQKLLHPLLPGSGKIMSKVYQTTDKRLKTIHRPKEVSDNDEDSEHIFEKARNLTPIMQYQNLWNPISKYFHENTDDEDEELASKDDQGKPAQVVTQEEVQVQNNYGEVPTEMEDNIASDYTNEENDRQHDDYVEEPENEPELRQEYQAQNSVDQLPVPQPIRANAVVPLEALAGDHLEEAHPQINPQEAQPEQGPDHLEEEDEDPHNARQVEEVNAPRKLVRAAPVKKNMKPKKWSTIKTSGIRKSKRLTSAKSKRKIKLIAARLNQNTSSDTESFTSEDACFGNNSSSEEEENDDNSGSELYEGDDEEEIIEDQIEGEENDDNNSRELCEEGDEEDDTQDEVPTESHDMGNSIRQLDGGITPDSLTSTSDKSLDSPGIGITLDALNLEKPGFIKSQNNVTLPNLARSRIMSTSEGQLSQHSNPNHQPSIWRRQLIRLRKFLDRLYRK